MTFEYVKLTNSELVYSKKNLLQSQMETLSAIKHLKAYQELRKEELLLKIALKTKIDEAKTALDVLDKLLPKTKIKDPELRRKEESLFIKHEKPTLDQEIDLIRKKLEKLQ